MEDELIKIIKEIQDNKRNTNVYPTHALKIEILYKMRERIEQSLEQLAEKGDLIAGTTINDSYYHLTHG